MGLQTHLGPQLLGTVKNNNPTVVTTNSPTSTAWPSFLGTTPTNGIRNLGVGDGTQFGSFVVGSSSFSTAQTGVTVPSGTAASAYTFYPGVYTVGPTGNQQFQPMVIPAGSYISAIVFDITTAFTASGSPTSATLTLNAIGAPSTTYATATNIVTHTGTIASSWTVQRNQVGTGSGFSVATAGIPYFVNTGATDTILQVVLTLGGGTSPTWTAGAGYLGINYTIRNPDGTWYPQTPAYPVANPPTITY